MNRQRAERIIAAGPQPGRCQVRLMASKRGHCWVRFHPPAADELIGRCDVIATDPLYAMRSQFGKPRHQARRIWPAHHRIINGQQVRMKRP